jgi:hypothetical protein
MTVLPSGLTRPPDRPLRIRKVDDAFYVLENAYEGEYEFSAKSPTIPAPAPDEPSGAAGPTNDPSDRQVFEEVVRLLEAGERRSGEVLGTALRRGDVSAVPPHGGRLAPLLLGSPDTIGDHAAGLLVAAILDRFPQLRETQGLEVLLRAALVQSLRELAARFIDAPTSEPRDR